MSLQFGNVVFVIWRESVEALLVVGILNAWLVHQGAEGTSRGRLFLWGGVAAGALVAVLLAIALMVLTQGSGSDTQQLVNTVIELVAAGLIIQMVLWMRQHGRTLKRDIEHGLSAAADRGNWWGVAALALVAVAREGSEAVVFLYGTWAAARHSAPGGFAMAVAIGLAAAVGTYMLLQIGSRLMSWQLFFRVTEVMLLCLAGSLLVTAADNLISLDIMPELSGRLWDSSALLTDTGRLGGLVSALTGYRARPNLAQVLVLALYWVSMAWLLLDWNRSSRRN
jgi:high-affinity iron transporter